MHKKHEKLDDGQAQAIHAQDTEGNVEWLPLSEDDCLHPTHDDALSRSPPNGKESAKMHQVFHTTLSDQSKSIFTTRSVHLIRKLFMQISWFLSNKQSATNHSISAQGCALKMRCKRRLNSGEVRCRSAEIRLIRIHIHQQGGSGCLLIYFFTKFHIAFTPSTMFRQGAHPPKQASCPLWLIYRSLVPQPIWRVFIISSTSPLMRVSVSKNQSNLCPSWREQIFFDSNRLKSLISLFICYVNPWIMWIRICE